jgi:hypothetical protein
MGIRTQLCGRGQCNEQDTPTRKYLVVLTVGYSNKVNVNAMVHKVINKTL